MAASSADMTSILGSLLGQGAVTGSSIVGNNAATTAQTTGYNNAINTLGQTQATNQTQLAPQSTTGNAASGNLATYLGLNGQPADFSQFYNTPGYQFAVQQGTQAINSQAAANGSAYTPNTLAAVGNYVQGAASTNYNNYINQLLQTSGQGLTANQGIVNSNTSLGTSAAQAQAQSGQATAAGAANQSGIISSALGALGGANGIGSLITNLLGGSSGSANASGVGGALGGLGTLINGAFSGSQQLPTIDTSGSAITGSAADTGSLGGNLISPPTIDTGDPGSGLNLDDALGDFSGAGGQAATSVAAPSPVTIPTVQNESAFGNQTPAAATPASPSASIGSDISSVGSIVGGVASGTSTGQAGAGLSAAQLAAKNNLFGSNSSAINSGAASGLEALGLYSGIKQGGVAGDTSAAINAAQLATKGASAVGAISSGTAGAIGSALGIAAIPLDLYNEVKSYQSGATVSDALSGAETGAAIGSIIPGIGTAIGAVAGAAVGAIASAFGGGRPDSETTQGQSIDAALASGAATPASAGLDTDEGAFSYLTGIMDAKNNTAGHSTTLEQSFGRMGESDVVNGMSSTIDSAISNGNMTMLPGGGVSFKTGGGTVTYPAGQAAEGVYSQVVAPWLTSKGASVQFGGTDVKGNAIGPALQTSLQTLVGSYINGSLTNQTVLDSKGDKDSTLAAFI